MSISAASQRCYLKVPEFAAYFGVAKQTVYRYVERGDLKAVRLGDRLCIPFSEVERLEREAGLAVTEAGR